MLSTFHRRVTEHNIGVVAQYYARITMERLSVLLELDIASTEEQLCEMVCAKQVYARIDRPRGIITFSKPKSANELLNGWSFDIASLLTKLEGTCHLIHKENMCVCVPFLPEVFIERLADGAFCLFVPDAFHALPLHNHLQGPQDCVIVKVAPQQVVQQVAALPHGTFIEWRAQVVLQWY